MSYEFIKLEKRGHIATVTLNRPEVMNALHNGIMDEIEDVSRSFLTDEQTRVVIFAGEGAHFSAGADMKVHFTAAGQPVLMKRRQKGLGVRMVRAISEINQVTIASVQGAALGIGACIPIVCDFRVGSGDCIIGFPEATLGKELMWTALPALVQLIGPAKAKKMVMSGNRENAQTLLNWGFLDEVIAREALTLKAWDLAEIYAALPASQVQMVKRSVNMITSSLEQANIQLETGQNFRPT